MRIMNNENNHGWFGTIHSTAICTIQRTSVLEAMSKRISHNYEVANSQKASSLADEIVVIESMSDVDRKSKMSSEDTTVDYVEPESANGAETDDGAKLDEVEEEPQNIELQFLSPEQRLAHTGDLLLAAVVEPEIEEDTEAAEALRANAQVKVGKVSKAARGINAQTVRKLVPSLRSRGMKRGKPPRVPPGLAASAQHQHQHPDHLVLDSEDNQIYAVLEEDDESDAGEDSDVESSVIKDAHSASQPNEVGKIGKSKSYDDKEKEDEVSNQSPKHSVKGHKASDNDTLATNGDNIPKHVVAETMDVERELMGDLDPHNMLQVQRWRRKKKSGKKKRNKSYVKGKVIDGKHELYTLSIAVMLGVRTSIARTNTIISSEGGKKKILSPQDFMAEEKYEFAPKVR